MPDEIKPALAPDGWRRLLLRDSRVISLEDGDVIDLGPMPGDSLHVLAALALYQQKFGFTHEMLRALDEAYRVVICAQNGGPVERTDDQLRAINDGLLAIGHRVAALLPPPEDANG